MQSLGVLTVGRLHLFIDQLTNNISTVITSSCGSVRCIGSVMVAIGLIDLHEVAMGGCLTGGSGAVMGLIGGHLYSSILELWLCERR